MGTMVLSNRSNAGSLAASSGALYDPIRQKWVAETPEEAVRQKLILHLIEELDFPAKLLVVEKGLRQIPHLSVDQKAPQRRADLVCFAKNGESLYPLLLVECKATPITSKMLRQAIGYNYFLKAAFIAIVGPFETHLGWFEKEKGAYQFLPKLLSYSQLLSLSSQYFQN